MKNKILLNSFIKIIYFLLLCILIAISLLIVNTLLKYDILAEHDTIFSYGRKFLEPEHGRFIATYINNLTTEVIPELLNIHPNDFQPLVMAPFKGIGVILICLLITFSAFIFSKKKLNLAFLCLYSLVFLLLFNNFFFFEHNNYFNIEENTVFFEYPMSLFLFVSFFGISAFYFVNDMFPSKPMYVILCILGFFLGISVDPINVPSFFILLLLGCYLIISKKSKIFENKKNLLLIVLLYFIYIIAMGFYFIRPVHHYPNYLDLSPLNYTVNYFASYTKFYMTDFIVKKSVLILPILIIILSLLLMKNYDKRKNKIIIYVSIHISIFLLFYLMLFFLGFNEEENVYWIHFAKWTDLYKVACLFYLLMIIGYLIDCNSKISENKSVIIKVTLCLLTLFIFNKPLVTDYYKNIQLYSNELKELRKTAYICEKYAITSKTDNIILPSDMKYSFSRLGMDFSKECGYQVYIRNIHPDIVKNQVEFSDDVDMNIFSKEELEDLRFQNLVQNKMYRHKKVQTGCYS